MPIKPLTAFVVLAAAMFAITPVQATVHKAHGKPVHAKHIQHKVAHAKSAHHKVTHARRGKIASAAHKTVHAHAATSSRAVAGNTLSTTAVAVAAMNPVLPASGLLQVRSLAVASAAVQGSPAWLSQSPVLNPMQMLVQSTRHSYSGAPANANVAMADVAAQRGSVSVDADADATDAGGNVTDLRKSLIAMAMKLRDTRYVRGGHDPSTGFDCSGFVRYVFAHAIGLQLPTNSASQFLAGLKVKRADMKPGDLVFFHTRGKRRISHVGIYISDGRFIHSPTTGKSVQISSLHEAYWAKHFAGAKRPEAMAMVAKNG